MSIRARVLFSNILSAITKDEIDSSCPSICALLTDTPRASRHSPCGSSASPTTPCTSPAGCRPTRGKIHLRFYIYARSSRKCFLSVLDPSHPELIKKCPVSPHFPFPFFYSVAWVRYPGLSEHESHERAKQYFRPGLFGPVLSFGVKGGRESEKEG